MRRAGGCSMSKPETRDRDRILASGRPRRATTPIGTRTPPPPRLPAASNGTRAVTPTVVAGGVTQALLDQLEESDDDADTAAEEGTYVDDAPTAQRTAAPPIRPSAKTAPPAVPPRPAAKTAPPVPAPRHRDPQARAVPQRATTEDE